MKFLVRREIVYSLLLDAESEADALRLADHAPESAWELQDDSLEVDEAIRIYPPEDSA